jgi:hypothetical protein
MTTLIDRRHVASHEAGHAVIARVLTMPCGGASIVGNKYSEGRIIMDHYEACEGEWAKRGKVRGPRAALDAAIMMAMAGVEAEVEFFRVSLDGSGEADMAKVEEWSFDEPGDRCKRNDRLRDMTRILVHRHRKLIASVSAALLAKGKLTSKQIDKLVGRSIEDVKPTYTRKSPVKLAAMP